MPKASPAKVAANNRYRDKAYKRVTLIGKPEEIEALQKAAAAAGLSTSRYIINKCLTPEKPE